MPDTRRPSPRLAGPALLVATFSGVALALLVLWQLTIARLFGTSPALDAFWIGLALPKTIADSFHFGLLTLLFVLVAARDEDDPASLTAAVLNLTFLLTIAAVLLIVAASPAIVAAMAPGLAPADQARATLFLRALAPVLGLTAISGALGGLAVARRDLLVFSISRAAIPAAQMAALLVLVRWLGAGALVCAIWAGAAASLLVYGRRLVALVAGYRPTLSFRGRTARIVLKLQGALALVWVFVSANQIASRYFASLLGPGQISALEFAWRFEIPIAQVVGFAVALPTFALLAANAGDDRRDDFRRVLAASTRLLMLGVVPLLGFLVVMRLPLSRIWFEGGAFSADAAAQVASLLPWLALVYLCRAFSSILVFGLLTIHRARLLLLLLATETLLNAGLSSVLSARFGLPGIAMASAAAMLVSNVSLWIVLLRDTGGIPLRAAIPHVAPALGSAALATAALTFARRFVPDAAGAAGLLPTIVAACGFGALYLLLCVGLGVIRIEATDGRPRVGLMPLESARP